MIWWQAPVDRINGTWIKHTIDANFEDVHNLRVADVNNDGNLDLVYAEQDQSDQHRVGIVFNVGGTGQNWQNQVLSTDGGHNQWAADDNGDGYIDILSSPHGYYTQVNPIQVYQNGLAASGITLPSYTSQPSSKTAPAGSSATFSVSVKANAAVAYLWMRNGVAIPGATAASYTLNSIAGSDSGAVFQCVVSDAAGFVNSAKATLTVAASAPSAPNGLVASADNSQVSLSWNASQAATGYNVYRGTTAGGETSTPINSSPISGTSFVDTNASNGTTYFYIVTAKNGIGESGPSNEANATPALPAPQPAPVGLASQPGNATVSLSWTAVTGATGYNVYRGTSSGGETATPLNASPLASASYTDSGVVNGTSYYYEVTAVNAGGESVPSNEASATPALPPAPAAPTGVTAAAGNNAVALSWAPVTGAYRLQRLPGHNSRG